MAELDYRQGAVDRIQLDLGRAGHVLCGSDYPHPEGLLWPVEFAEEIAALGATDTRRIMRDNLAGLIAGS